MLYVNTQNVGRSILLLLASWGLTDSLYAQQANAPALPEILERLQENLDHYDQRVPSFFCDEHVISQVDSALGKKETTTDSTFRLKRIVDLDHTTSLEESREIKTVDGKPPMSKDRDMEGPSLLEGVFEGGLAVVSSKQTSCMKYELQKTKSKQPVTSYVIRFSTKLTPQNMDSCLLQENSNGTAIIDAASMQIRHIEITTPKHTIIAGDVYTGPELGKRVLVVDYVPVVLEGETLWMPANIAMNTTSGENSFRKTIWTFKAAYRNFHKLQVSIQIHSGSAGNEP